MALTPLLVTVIVLLGGMAWIGIDLTMATQVAFPILFGLGVAYGVHMVHRLSENRDAGASRAVGTTGKAVGLAAATTMAGFGAMMIAKHSALVGFGTVLASGFSFPPFTALFLHSCTGHSLSSPHENGLEPGVDPRRIASDLGFVIV